MYNKILHSNVRQVYIDQTAETYPYNMKAFYRENQMRMKFRLLRFLAVPLLIVIGSVSCNSSIGFPTETPLPFFPTPSVQPTATPVGTLFVMSGSNSQTSQVFPIATGEKLQVRWKYFRFGEVKLIMNIYKAGDRTTPTTTFDTGELEEGSKELELPSGSYYMTIQSGTIQNWTVTLVKGR